MIEEDIDHGEVSLLILRATDRLSHLLLSATNLLFHLCFMLAVVVYRTEKCRC